MGKNGIPEQQKFNYGKHREKYQKEIFQLIEDIKIFQMIKSLKKLIIIL
ncbi:unclassified [Brachyspira pilosicoli WesB]|uniref:Unclassified n=1 Tax=Brachyspira pilosicoli WesB TaxID=1161918 RepID=K0JIC6_BRAPL|nr:hypothetical protein [Brachyspira pilosicoli]CCG57968.1 unclassified [Brachyspira pilosicoli WesB]